MSLLLGIKVLASPTLIGAVSVAGRRWGPNIAGLLGGLPLVGGPIVLALWLSEGVVLAQAVAQSASVGVWATLAYLLSLGHFSAYLRWYLAIPCSWVPYVGVALLLEASGLARSQVLGVAVIPGLILTAATLLPRQQRPVGAAPLPRVELLARMAAAVVLVLTLTGLAHVLGAELTGLLAGAPVAASVIPAFTFATQGRDALLAVLRGFLTGLTGFAAFFLVLTPMMKDGGWPVLLPATLAALIAGVLAQQLLQTQAGRDVRSESVCDDR